MPARDCSEIRLWAMTDSAREMDSCLQRMGLCSELFFDVTDDRLPSLEGFVLVCEPDGRRSLWESDTFKEQVAAGRLPPGAAFQ